jgi:ribonuclease BN (tRNA processing enzyme)
MAVRAGARRLLLIHVSARYHDPHALLQEAAAVFPQVEVAHDLMEMQV